MGTLIDITNKKFNKLTAIKFAHKDEKGFHFWYFICECGKIKIQRKTSVMANNIKSCGCLQNEIAKEMSTTHNMTHSKEYSVWHNIKQRIYNKKNNNYKHYGARGITVCKEWDSFENFISDMGKAPSKNHSIDRINNDLGYFKENCRWATRKEQDRNTRRNKFISYNGKTQCVSDWAKEYGISCCLLNQRYFILGWDIERALTEKVNKKVA